MLVGGSNLDFINIYYFFIHLYIVLKYYTVPFFIVNSIFIVKYKEKNLNMNKNE